MRLKATPLVIIEAIAVVSFIILLGFLGYQNSNPSRQLQPLTQEALVNSSAEERWNGIFLEDQHVGYSVQRTSTSDSGEMLFEQRSVFRINTFGSVQEVVTAGAALTDTAGMLRRFDFFMVSGEIKLSARGEVSGNSIVMEVDQGGEISNLDFSIDEPPHVSLSLESVIRRQTLQLGHSFTVPYFDPITMSNGEMTLRVVDSEVLENGEEAWWLATTFGDIETRSLVTTGGDVLRQEGALGLSVVRMTAESAQAVPIDDDPVDLIALSMVPLEGKLKKPRDSRKLTVQVSGIPLEKLTAYPPLQIIKDDLIIIDVPLLEELPELSIETEDTESQWLEGTITLPVNHLEIVEKASELVKGSSNRLEAAQKINQFVFDHMEKVPAIGVPNGLQSLRSAQGDCNEHTALFVTLARAAGIPSRIAAGIVFSDRAGPIGGFYYHAWPEVQLGGPSDWVPIDPTFGQFPADATHIKLAEGDLDQQVEIMGYVGRLKLKLIDHL